MFDNLTSSWSKRTLFNKLSKHAKTQAIQILLRRIFVQKVAECELEVLPKQMEEMLKAEEYTKIMDKFIQFQSERQIYMRFCSTFRTQYVRYLNATNQPSNDKSELTTVLQSFNKVQ